MSHLLGVLEAVVALVALMLTLAVAWRVSTGGGAAAVTELSEANKVLSQRIHDLRNDYERKISELGAQVRDLKIENAKLLARTDYRAVMNEHETRAQSRHEAQLHVLELIASRLGPDDSIAA